MSAQIIPFPKVHRNGQSPTLDALTAEMKKRGFPCDTVRIEYADEATLKKLCGWMGYPWGAK